MLRYKFIDTFNIFKEKPNEFGTYIYNGPKVNAENSEWFLFQIGRDVQLSKNIVDVSLRDDFKRKNYSYEERDIYMSILKTYLCFLTDWEKDIKLEKKMLLKEIYEKKKLVTDNLKPKKKHKIDIEIGKLENKLELINGVIERFVKSIIETRIVIENNMVYLFSDNLELFKKIKQVVLDSSFTFREIDLVRAKSWWEQITKEN